MTTTNPTTISSSSQMYGSMPGGSKQTANVTDVFFAETLNTEYQNKQSTQENNYDKSVTGKTVKEKQVPESSKPDNNESQRTEKQDENKPVDDVDKKDDQPKTEEKNTEKTDNQEGKVDDNDKADKSENEEETALDALASQPESLNTQQQAIEAISVLDIENADFVLTDQELDTDSEIDAGSKSDKNQTDIKPVLDLDSGKTNNNLQEQNKNKNVKQIDLVNTVNSNTAKEQKTDISVDGKTTDQALIVDDIDAQDGESANLKTLQTDTQEVETATQLNTVKEEVSIEAKTDEVVTEKDGNGKKIDYKDFKQDYNSSQENMSQQSSDFSDMNEKDTSRDRGFDRGENLSKISFASSSVDDNKNIQQTLGLDKANEKIDIDTAKNVENVVKTVKTMVSGNNSTMVVRLDPPELGEMRINIRSGSDGMSIEIQAANAKSQQMLQQSSGQLRSALENSGINVNNVDVQFKPDIKNNANAGSDFQDDQSNMFDQNNNQNMADNGHNSDESFQQNFNNWSDTAGFEDAEFSTEENVENVQSGSEQWQEITFDAVNVLV